MQLQTILNHVEKHKSFVYAESKWREKGVSLEIKIEARRLHQVEEFFHCQKGIVDHPGFNWSTNPSYVGTRLRHLVTICQEEDPELRKQKIEKYAAEVREEFAKMAQNSK